MSNPCDYGMCDPEKCSDEECETMFTLSPSDNDQKQNTEKKEGQE